MTPQEAAAALPRLTEEQVGRIVALLSPAPSEDEDGTR